MAGQAVGAFDDNWMTAALAAWRSGTMPLEQQMERVRFVPEATALQRPANLQRARRDRYCAGCGDDGDCSDFADFADFAGLVGLPGLAGGADSVCTEAGCEGGGT